MGENNFIDKLILSLKLYTGEKISFQDLEISFYDVFVENELEIEDDFENVFSEICEKMDFTSIDELNDEDKKYGWINEQEFKDWLKLKILEIEKK